MTYEEYFGQENFYFSESEQKKIYLPNMAIPHLAHAYRKLLREAGHNRVPYHWARGHGFLYSPLYWAMLKILRPSAADRRELMNRHGEMSYLYFSTMEIPCIRSKFYRTGKDLGVPIKTHTDKVVGLVRAEIIRPATVVNVRKRSNAA